MSKRPRTQVLDLPSVSCVASDKSFTLSGPVSPFLAEQNSAVITALQGGFENQKRQWVGKG